METFAQLEPYIVDMEACGGAHHWARALRRLEHEPRLMAPQLVSPYRKNDNTTTMTPKRSAKQWGGQTSIL